jgi:hypothetical protein
MTEDHSSSAGELADSPLDDGEEPLYRQVHPSWVQDGVPSSLAFKPTKKDAGMLSISLGSKATPKGAFDHHTKDLGLQSAGTWAVMVAEVAEAGLNSYAQPIDGSPDHGFIDFRELSRGQTEKTAKVLLARARDRGCLHTP